MLSNVFPERAAVQAPPMSISYSRLSPAFGVSITCIPISSFDVPGDAVGYPDVLLAVEYCCASLGPLVRHCIVELLRERELRPALALEGGAPRAPYRKRAAKHRSLPAPFTHQHYVPDGAFHVTLLSVGSGSGLHPPPLPVRCCWRPSRPTRSDSWTRSCYLRRPVPARVALSGWPAGAILQRLWRERTLL